MPIPRIHTPQPLAAGAVVELDEAAANHVTRVLRMRDGAALVLFNGEGGEYAAVLDRTQRNRAWAQLESFVPREAESPLTLTLAQGISKGERMDYTVQKAVELGVATIIPLLTARTVVQLKGERLARRQRHWQAIAVSACEQCGRNRIPEVCPPVPLQAWLQHRKPLGLGLMLDHRAATALTQIPAGETRFTLLAGPEGGLSPNEIQQLRAAGFMGIRLGPRVLRTETAAVTMLASLQTLLGDFR